MSTINIGTLPTVTSADVRDNTGFLVNTTDSNGLPYTGLLPLNTLQGDAGCLCVKTATLTLTPTQIKNGNTTPITFGLTVPSGYAAMAVNVIWRLEWATTAYDVGDVAEVRAVGAAEYQMRSNAGFLQSTADYMATSIGGYNSVNIIDGADLQVVIDADSSVGDSPLTAYLTYILIQL